MDEEGKITRLDLGCGFKKQPGYYGIDSFHQEGVDKVMDLDNPKLHLPFEDDSISEIRAYHFLEHIDNLFPLMNECYRILQFNGHLDIVVPLGYVAAFGDPDHKRAFSETSFHHFTSSAPGNYINPKIKGMWKILLNDWSPPYSEDTTNITVHKQRELHVFMQPVKSPPEGWNEEMDKQ